MHFSSLQQGPDNGLFMFTGMIRQKLKILIGFLYTVMLKIPSLTHNCDIQKGESSSFLNFHHQLYGWFIAFEVVVEVDQHIMLDNCTCVINEPFVERELYV